MNLFQWTARHVRAILLLVGGLCVLGGLIVLRLPVAIFPDLTIPRIIIAAEGGDAPTENILVSVTRPMEDAVSTIPGLQMVQSQTTRGSAGFTLTFADGTDMNGTLQVVQSRLAEVRADLPAGMTVTAERLNPTVFPILDYAVTSNTRSLADLRVLALYTLKPRLARVPGVARIMVNGGDTREMVVTADSAKLAARGIALSQLNDAISKANTVNAVGSFDTHYVRHVVLISGVLSDAASIGRVVVSVSNRIPITVADVATVAETVRRRTVLATGGGHEAVLLNIVRQPDGNTIEVADGVRRELASLRAALPADVTLTPFYDQSLIVRESEVSVIESILVGGVLALIVVALFLRNAKTAFTALSMLPLTLLITFAVMRLLHMTLNIMTLGGIAIALGLVIDDAIVVVEHIFQRLEQGDTKVVAITVGLREITPAMLASSAATIVTFLPLLLLPGVTGSFFAPLAQTMIATLLVSLLLSLTFVPLMAAWVFPAGNSKGGAHSVAAHGPGPVRTRRGIYARLAPFLFTHRWATLIVIVPLGIGALTIGSRLPTGFMPEFDEGAFVLDYKMPAGTSLNETDRVLRQVEDVLKATDGVETWSRLTGALSGSGLEITALSQGDMVIRLKSGRRPASDAIMEDIRTKLAARFPNLSVEMVPILGDLIGDLAGTPSPIQVKVFGPDINRLTALAGDVKSRIDSIHGVVDTADGITESGPETLVKVDPVRASAMGLSTDAITDAAAGALDGHQAGNIRRGDLLEPIRVQYPFVAQRSETELAAVPIINPSGKILPLGSVADIQNTPGSPELIRENQRLMLSVTGRLEGLDLGSGIQAVKAKLADMPLPAGYSLEYGGLYKSQQESFQALTAVLVTAAVFVFCVLIFTFRSFRAAGALFIAAVLSLSGVVLALWITGTPLNISSYTGAIMIVGIVTENGVLLFDEFARLRREDEEAKPEDLLAEAGNRRLRPILMTTFAAILTLFPLALGIGAGAAMQKPLAVAVIGGLTLSMFFTLIVAPAAYLSMTGWMVAAKRLIRRRKLAPSTVD